MLATLKKQSFLASQKSSIFDDDGHLKPADVKKVKNEKSPNNHVCCAWTGFVNCFYNHNDSSEQFKAKNT